MNNEHQHSHEESKK